MKTIAIVYGTRPEAIKLAPVVRILQKISGIKTLVISTGQHTSLLNQAEESIGLTPDVQLAVGVSNQTLHQSFSTALEKLATTYAEMRPDLVVVQGDTNTAVAASLAAFYSKIPVAHVEAGLRTHNLQSPFPEEANRVLIDQISTLLFPPTEISAHNLQIEGITKNVHIVGNTVVDAFNLIKLREPSFIPVDQPYLVFTMHRRENFGSPMRSVCKSIIRLVSTYDLQVLAPVHPNPEVQKVMSEELSGHSRVRLLPPMNYVDFLSLMAGSQFLLSDSGGVQEEAILLKKSVLILRDNTERPEVVTCGVGHLVGTSSDRIFEVATFLLKNSSSLSVSVNPLGDGTSSQKIVSIILDFLK